MAPNCAPSRHFAAAQQLGGFRAHAHGAALGIDRLWFDGPMGAVACVDWRAATGREHEQAAACETMADFANLSAKMLMSRTFQIAPLILG
jgi:hypothetical protein